MTAGATESSRRRLKHRSWQCTQSSASVITWAAEPAAPSCTHLEVAEHIKHGGLRRQPRQPPQRELGHSRHVGGAPELQHLLDQNEAHQVVPARGGHVWWTCKAQVGMLGGGARVEATARHALRDAAAAQVRARHSRAPLQLRQRRAARVHHMHLLSPRYTGTRLWPLCSKLCTVCWSSSAASLSMTT